jgi:hypothetical protein
MEVREMTQEVRMARWAEIIRGRQESGLTVREYCAHNGINEKGYYYWQQRIRRKLCELANHAEGSSPSKEPLPAFAEVQIRSDMSVSSAAIKVHLGDAVVEIPNNASAEVVQTVLRTLREPC